MKDKPDTQLIDALKPLNQWSLQFGTELHRILEDIPADETYLLNLLHNYAYTSNRLAATVSSENIFENIDNTDSNRRVLQSLGFHGLTGAALGIWQKVLSGTTHIPHSLVHETQTYVATNTVFDMKERVEEVEHIGYTAYVGKPHGNSRDGDIAEGDAYITALEISKKHPHIAILPAPLQFESSPIGRRNADLIAIDLIEKHALGIQVKTSTKNLKIQYDSRYVMLIDGRDDLENTKHARLSPVRSRTGAVNWPGLVSAHFLLENSHAVTKKRAALLLARDKRATLAMQQRTKQAKYMARTLIGGTRPKNAEAASRVENRLLHNLYKE